MNKRQAKKAEQKYYCKVVAFKNYLTVNMNDTIDEQDLWNIVLLGNKPEKINNDQFMVINNVIKAGTFLGRGYGEDAVDYYVTQWLMPATCDVINWSWGKHGPKFIRSAVVYDTYDEEEREVV